MDPNQPSPSPRKVKFAPKGPNRRAAKSTTAKIESSAMDGDSASEAQQQALSRKVNEHLTRSGPRLAKKSSAEVAFSHDTASTAIRTFGKQKESTDDRTRSDVVDVEDSGLDAMQDIITSTSTAGTGVVENSDGLTDGLTVKKKGEYKEPWDYQNSYYPTTVPSRRPFSGDPELLDKAEFENAVEYDENTMHSASDLGLLDKDDKPKMIFFQFPSDLPFIPKEVVHSSLPSAAPKGKEIAGSTSKVSGISTGTKGKEIAGSSMNLGSGHSSNKASSLEQLPEGYMGKMLVYKSGAVKLKLGDILYDVSPGSDCAPAQSVVAINTINTHCCNVGEPTKRAVVTPDLDFMLDHTVDLG